MTITDPAPLTAVPTPPPGVAALERLADGLAVPVDHMTVTEIRAQMCFARAARAVADGRLVALHRRLTDLAASPTTPIAVDPTRELRTHGGLASRDVRSVNVQAAAVDAAPVLGDLLATGCTTAAHVEAVGHALAVAGDGQHSLLAHLPSIAERAVTSTVADFSRFLDRLARDAQPDEGLSLLEHQQRSTELRIWTGRDGMTRYTGAYDPLRGAAFAGLLDRHVEAMFHSGDRDIPVDVAPGIDPNDHRRALALHALCTRASHHGEPRPGEAVDPRPVRAEVIVHVDHHTLVHGLHEKSVCRTGQGADLPPATVRRLACDADIIPLVLAGGSVPLDVGRARRLATVHQRRALEAIHTTCAVSGCEVSFARCTVHHLDPWGAGGRTDLHNLVPLCTRHHHAAHEGGWVLTLDPATRHLTVTIPGAPPGDDPTHGNPTHGKTAHGKPASTARPPSGPIRRNHASAHARQRPAHGGAGRHRAESPADHQPP